MNYDDVYFIAHDSGMCDGRREANQNINRIIILSGFAFIVADVGAYLIKLGIAKACEHYSKKEDKNDKDY